MRPSDTDFGKQLSEIRLSDDGTEGLKRQVCEERQLL